ncbi:hypothetical protein G6F68_018995 [Rhizopus microsporus]|nr:hypothetical protein G6F68_018995 [Rhizopus microsporus]
MGPFPALGVAGGGWALRAQPCAAGRQPAASEPDAQHPQRGRAGHAEPLADQRAGGADGGAGRRVCRHRRRGRLRHRRAAGVSADSDRLRAGRPHGRDGGVQHRRGAA